MNEKVVPFRAPKAPPIKTQTGPVSAPGEMVPIIACSTCSSSTFNLSHDRRIICACCHLQILAISWVDHQAPNPAA